MDDIRNSIETALSGSYSIERELGGGGMSRTYLATETALGRQVVIKVLAPDLLAGISVERFRREVLMAARLQHPHVVPVLTTGETGGVPWFTMPYVDGESLRERLASGPLGIGETVGFLRDVARALAYAHSHGVVHRDIKPDNVLVSAGSATVTDFGIAKAINAARAEGGEAAVTLTQAGTAIGTPAYMSPEQVLGEEVDHRTDVYSYGVMAWELLAGHAPFRAGSSAKLIAAHLTEVPRDIAQVRQDCPAPLARLVMRCMAKDAADRPQSAAELTSALSEVTTGNVTGGGVAAAAGERMRLGRALVLWGAATVGITLVAWAATHALGLPDWVITGSFGVMLLGLPAVLLTAYVQHASEGAGHGTRPGKGGQASRPHGTLATAALRASPHVSWRRTWLGGATAIGAFVVIVVGYMVLRTLGIGPMATLQARGAFGDRETLVVADFRSPASDPELGTTIAEALRTDLGQSQTFRVLTRAALRDLLTPMQRSDESVLSFALAREIATREGAKAVLDGEVMQVGQGYVLSARLVSALDGTELATFRREARSENDLLPELGRLSRAVRERAGESLRDIRASRDIERVTTPSLAALRKYVEGVRMYSEGGDRDRALVLLQESVALDTAFAMAWRAMATAASTQLVSSRTAERNYLATAYRHRDRLTEPERLLTEGTYFTNGPEPDYDRALESYEKLLQLDPTSIAGLNNAAGIRSEFGDHELAEEYLRAVIKQPAAFALAYTSLVREQVLNGRSVASIDSTVAAYRERFPESVDLLVAEMTAAWGTGRYELADSLARAGYERHPSAQTRMMAAWMLADLTALQGRSEESLRWYSVITDALHGGDRKTDMYAIHAAIDSAYYHGLTLGDPDRGRGYLDRAIAVTPMDDLAPLDRPWYNMMALAVETQDSVLAESIVTPFLRDWPPLTTDSAGSRTAVMAEYMHATGNWDEAIRLYHEARKARTVYPKYHLRWVGMAHDAAGRPDSAIVWLERYIAQPDPDAHPTGNYLPRVHRRLGEIYEDRGDIERAVSHYSAFINFWRDADPVLQPEVEEARRRVERLTGESG